MFLNIKVKNLILFILILPSLFWYNPYFGEYFRFAYLLVIFIILGDFILKRLNNFKIIYLLIFFLIHACIVFFFEKEFLNLNFFFSILVVLFSYLILAYILTNYNLFKNLFNNIINFYAVLFFIFFLLAFFYNSKLFASYNLSCFYEYNTYQKIIFGENSHVAILSIQIFLYMIFQNRIFGFVNFLVICLFFNSLTVLVSTIIASISSLIIFRKKIEMFKKIYFILLLTLSFFIIVNKNNCNSRLLDVVIVYNDILLKNNKPADHTKNKLHETQSSNKEAEQQKIKISKYNLESKNLSAQVIIFNLMITYKSIINYPFGVGINNYKISFNKFKYEIKKKYKFDNKVYYLNNNDAGSIIPKFITEFGLFSLFFLLLLFKFIINKKIDNSFKFLIIFALIIHSIRGVGYFNGLCIFLILIIVIFSFKNNLKYIK